MAPKYAPKTKSSLQSANQDTSVRVSGQGDVGAETSGQTKRFSVAEIRQMIMSQIGPKPTRPKGMMPPHKERAYKQAVSSWQAKYDQLYRQYTSGG